MAGFELPAIAARLYLLYFIFPVEQAAIYVSVGLLVTN